MVQPVEEMIFNFYSTERYKNIFRHTVILLCEETRFFAQQYFVKIYFSRTVILTIFVLEYWERLQDYIFG